MELEVAGNGGRIVAEKTLAASTGGHETLDRDVECPDGLLVDPRPISRLEAENMDTLRAR